MATNNTAKNNYTVTFNGEVVATRSSHHVYTHASLMIYTQADGTKGAMCLGFSGSARGAEKMGTKDYNARALNSKRNLAYNKAHGTTYSTDGHKGLEYVVVAVDAAAA